MSSTVTTAVLALDLSSVLGGAATILLIALLAYRELAATAGARPVAIARNATVTIATLLVTFGIIAVGRVLMLA